MSTILWVDGAELGDVSSGGLPGSPEAQAGGVHCSDAVRASESPGRPVEAFEIAALWALFRQLLGLLDDLSRGLAPSESPSEHLLIIQLRTDWADQLAAHSVRLKPNLVNRAQFELGFVHAVQGFPSLIRTRLNPFSGLCGVSAPWNQPTTPVMRGSERSSSHSTSR